MTITYYSASTDQTAERTITPRRLFASEGHWYVDAWCEVADGVVVGSALVRRLLEGAGPEGAAEFVGSLRAAVDAG